MAGALPAFVMGRRVSRRWRKHDPAGWPSVTNATDLGLARYEYGLHSQNGEDGILRHLFDRVGFESRRSIEFGFGYSENCSLRLARVEGFESGFIDGSERTVRIMNAAARAAGLSRVRAIHRFLDLDNLNATMRELGADKGLDLLVIDVDGNDLWFWESLAELRPRVAVVEYQAGFGPDRAVTIPYDPKFDRSAIDGLYHGASLEALRRVSERKGYALVGCDSWGVNAFFVRRDLVGDLPVLTSKEAFRVHRARVEGGLGQDRQEAYLASMPLVEIGASGSA